MEWNNNIAGNSCNQLIRQPNFVSHQTSFNFLYNYNHHFSGTEMKESTMTGTQAETEDVGMMMEDNGNKKNGNGEIRKKRMTSEQLEYLENRFQEEIKLDPDRKIKLSQELGLQPRQVAVWFQNRRARWKTKQLEHLYLSLKHQLDLVSREKHKLQEEVVALRAVVQDEAIRRKQVWGGSYNSSSNNIDISGGGEDTVESTSALVNPHPQPQLQTPVKNTGERDNYVVFSDYNINSSTSNSTYYNLAGAATASAHLVMPSNYP